VTARRVSHFNAGGYRPPDEEGTRQMATYIQVFRGKVRPDDVARLIEIRPKAVAEAQAACPERCTPSWSVSTTTPGWTS
jgi:hypothetical protein